MNETHNKHNKQHTINTINTINNTAKKHTHTQNKATILTIKQSTIKQQQNNKDIKTINETQQ